MERDLCTHDEILLEVPIEATDEVALTLKRTMEMPEGVF
jgi:DNA polymerase I-like protein with 3'-5' exonuclease and polymerase domains